MHTHSCLEPTVLEEQLRSIGARFTKVRKALLHIFTHHSSPLSVPELLDCLKQEGLQVNKTTVYRELDFLLEKALLQELDFGDRKKRYELASRGHHHHLICQVCHSIEDIAFEEELSAEEKIISEKTGFTVLRHNLEFFGICQSCAQ